LQRDRFSGRLLHRLGYFTLLERDLLGQHHIHWRTRIEIKVM
jgi:hypothetical protein